jgi:hypothetical protein
MHIKKAQYLISSPDLKNVLHLTGMSMPLSAGVMLENHP